MILRIATPAILGPRTVRDVGIQSWKNGCTSLYIAPGVTEIPRMGPRPPPTEACGRTPIFPHPYRDRRRPDAEWLDSRKTTLVLQLPKRITLLPRATPLPASTHTSRTPSPSFVGVLVSDEHEAVVIDLFHETSPRVAVPNRTDAGITSSAARARSRHPASPGSAPRSRSVQPRVCAGDWPPVLAASR